MSTQSTNSVLVQKHLTLDDLSPYQRFRYPLPTGDDPGEWVEVPGLPVVGAHGFHGYEQPYPFETHSVHVYEMELVGEVSRSIGLVAGTRARLLRRLALPTPDGLIEEGFLRCKACGEPHNLYGYGDMRSWASLEDGHVYASESWESLARRLLAGGKP